MKNRGLYILLLALGLSFWMGRLAGKRSMNQIESSFLNVFQGLEAIQDIEKINQMQPENHRKSLFSDPNL